LKNHSSKCLVAGSAGLCSVAGDIEVALSDPDEPPGCGLEIRDKEEVTENGDEGELFE